MRLLLLLLLLLLSSPVSQLIQTSTSSIGSQLIRASTSSPVSQLIRASTSSPVSQLIRASASSQVAQVKSPSRLVDHSDLAALGLEAVAVSGFVHIFVGMLSMSKSISPCCFHYCAFRPGVNQSKTNQRPSHFQDLASWSIHNPMEQKYVSDQAHHSL